MHDIIKCLNYEMFRESGIVPDPNKVEAIKNVDTDIIIDPLYLKYPEDLGIFAHMMGERPWDILCRSAYAKRGKKK